MKTRKQIVIATIPTWAIDSASRNRHTIAAAFELAGLMGKWVRLNADAQRALFGFAMFGKVKIRCTVDGVVASRSVCFGTDFSTIDLSWGEVESFMVKQQHPKW